MSHDEIKCPTARTTASGERLAIIGCGSTNVIRDDSEPNLYDCLDCGIFFDPSKEV